MKTPLKALVALLLVAGAASCGAVRPSKFYSLELPTGATVASSPMPVTLLVGRITAPHILRDDRVAYRTSPTEIGVYEYHRWSEPPASMLEALLVRRLRADGRYKSVQALSSNAEGDYILRGRLHNFEEAADGAGLVARVSLEMELFEKKTGNVVWSNLYKSDEPVAIKEVSAVVEAMNRGTQKVLDQVAGAMAAYFAQHPPKN